MTWENTWWIIIDSNVWVYTTTYCQNYSDWVCLQSTTTLSLSKNDIKEIWVEILSVAVAFGFSLWVVVWLIKWLFRLIFPWKWRK